jgi:hypothetical protein
MNSVPPAPSRTATDTLTRVVAGFLVLILVDAAQLLLFYPGRTATLWAWKLQPEVTAMALGSVYVAGAYFFGRVLFGAPWPRVAAGFPPIALFVWLAAIATILHEDRFIKDSLPFAAWVALYTVTPIGVPLLYLYNRRRAGGPDGPPLPRRLRAALAAAGGALALAGLVIFVAPDVAIGAWPWTLTPLTARIVGAVIALYGALWVSVATDGTWAGARIPLQAHALGLAFLLLAVARGHDAIDWGNALAVVFVTVAGAMLAISAALARAGP